MDNAQNTPTYFMKLTELRMLDVYTITIKIKSYAYASRVESELIDGTYKLVPKCDEGRQEGELNVIKPNQGPSQESEEHQANRELEGKPHSITYIF